MTAGDVYSAVLKLMFATTAQDENEYNDIFISQLNITLTDCFAQNNALRASRNKAALTSVPTVTALSDEMTYEDEFCRLIIPYGVAGYIFMDDDMEKAAEYRNKYEYEKEKMLGVAVYTEIEDYYA